MKPSAALLIDGSNFYHSLKATKRLPFGAEGFGRLFELLSERFELKQIYFYDALKDRINDPNGYAGQQRFHASLKRLRFQLAIKTRKLRYLANLTKQNVEAAASSVGIADSSRSKIWEVLKALGLVKLTKEKGIDVMIVADAIELARTKSYETMIILSGDGDFTPAVELIKKFGVLTVNLHLYHGSSTELRNACDRHILIDFDEAGVCLGQ